MNIWKINQLIKERKSEKNKCSQLVSTEMRMNEGQQKRKGNPPLVSPSNMSQSDSVRYLSLKPNLKRYYK